MSRSIFLSTVFAFALLAAPIGCAVTSSQEDEANSNSDEQVDSTSDELTSTAQSFVGHYYTHQAGTQEIARLTLDKGGKYTASVESKNAICVTSPCLVTETGVWNVTKSASNVLRLRLRPANGSSRYYVTTLSNQTLTLTRAGQLQKLSALSANQCLDDADCAASEECGPKFCLMWCQVNDPFCCGPSTCQPKAPPPPPPPPPPPSCWGAWLDQNGLCRTPADGVYPDSCCAGPACGPSQCGAGEVCCNPLSGICTAPGMVCAM